MRLVPNTKFVASASKNQFPMSTFFNAELCIINALVIPQMCFLLWILFPISCSADQGHSECPQDHWSNYGFCNAMPIASQD
jgi:hypothetical protein